MNCLNFYPKYGISVLITPQQYHELREAYIFLRRTENVLQAIDDQQTQLLPTDEENRLRLMVACREYTYLDEKNQATIKILSN